MAGAWEADSFRNMYLPTRLHLISGWRMLALAWSAKGQFLNRQSRVCLKYGHLMPKVGPSGSARLDGWRNLYATGNFMLVPND